MRTLDALDGYQRRHSWLGAPLAVTYKFFDDRGPYLAALVTYYGFVSLFPLMLVFSSSLGFFLQSDQRLRQQLVHSALADFPIIGPQLSANVSGFHGSGVGLTVGVIATLYGGTGVMQASQAAFNQIYGVPRNEQPNPFTARLRSLGLLALLGGGVVLSTGVATLVGTTNGISSQLGVGLRLAGIGLSLAINIALFTGAFQLLTARQLRSRQVVTGGIIAALCWEALQTAGTSYASHELRHTSAVYGTFGLVLATIAWIYLEAFVIMICAEINVVSSQRLWPRALLTPFTDNVELTDADHRAYAMYARTQRFKGFQTIRVEFSTGAAEHPDQSGTRPPAERPTPDA